jgi:4-amino-4-deoxychorismate lyase
VEGAFRGPLPGGLKIIETLGRAPGGYPRAARHLARMERTAARLGVAFDRARARAALESVPGGAARRVRLTLDLAGRFELSHAPLGPARTVWRLAPAAERLDPADPWLTVKTTARAVYDAARAGLPADIEERVFLNTRGELCEGTITNIFLDTGAGALLTPALSSGLLPGILREELLESGQARAAVLTPADMAAARAVYVGNALRGLIRAELAGAW